jgi:hypothetical protein
MSGKILHVADDFWNIRGSYRVGGVIDVGTQASLVRLASGKFVLLDSYTLSGAVKRQVGELTSGGKDIDAILNVHPFHTVHVRKMHELYPHATLYGTARHKAASQSFPGPTGAPKIRLCMSSLRNISNFRCRAEWILFPPMKMFTSPRYWSSIDLP